MKIACVVVALFLAGCSVNTSDKINIDTKKIRYVQDSSTGLCFAFVASRKFMTLDATGLGFTEVPCSEIPAQ